MKPHGASERWHLEIHIVTNLETEISSSFVSIDLLSGLGYLQVLSDLGNLLFSIFDHY